MRLLKTQPKAVDKSDSSMADLQIYGVRAQLIRVYAKYLIEIGFKNVHSCFRV